MEILPGQPCVPPSERGQNGIPQFFDVIGGKPESGGEDARLVAAAGMHVT